MISCQTVVNIMEKLAPKKLAYDWDNPGMMVGDFARSVDKILTTLTVTEQTVDYAIKNGYGMIVSHHPLIFKPIKALRYDLPLGKILYKAIKNDIVIYSAHTNLDVAFGGVNDVLADALQLENIAVLKPYMKEELKKVVIYVPKGFEEDVRNALFQAGAGHIGNYSHCSFNVEGYGTYKPLEGTQPFIGKIGNVEKTGEYRIETVVPENLVNKVINAAIKVHPYEEVAYDIFPLDNDNIELGLGRIGTLKSEMNLKDFSDFVKKCLNATYIRVVGNFSKPVRKVALCGGAGADLISTAKFRGADVYITGDVKYHDAVDAKSVDIAVIDAGHFATENLMMPKLAKYLTEQAEAMHQDVKIEVYTDEEPFVIV